MDFFVNLFCDDTSKNFTLPYFPQCLQHSILVFGPCLFFWLLFPVLVLQVHRSRKANRFLPLPLSPLFLVKAVIAGVLLVDAIFIFTVYSDDKLHSSPTSVVDITYPVLLALTAGGLLFAHFQCRRAGIVSSGIIFNTWLLFLICGCPELYEWIQKSTDDSQPSSNGRNIAFFIWWAGCFLETLFFCFADKRSEKDNVGVEHQVSFINHILLYWFNRLPSTGFRKNLEPEDMFPLHKGIIAENLEALWDHYWIPTFKKYNNKRKSFLIAQSCLNLKSMKNESSSSPTDSENPIPELLPPSVVYNIFKMFRFEFIGAMAIKTIADSLSFMNPLLLNKLLDNISDPNGQLWHGLLFGIMMFVVSELRSFMVNYSITIVFRVGIKVQSALTAAVYRKTLKLSNVSRKNRSVGEIVNLMAIDIERLQMTIAMSHSFWSSPFQITVAMILLFSTLGVAALPGVLITCSYVPYTIMTSRVLRDWMVTQMKLKDERTKMCNEILNGIKVVKLYAWELPMLHLIEKIRKKELRTLLKSTFLRMTVDIFNWSTPFLVALCSFATFIWTNPNNILTPQIAFVSLTLFNQLRFPMTIIGMLINLTVDAIVSNKRLKEFFVAEELEEDAVEKEALIPETTEVTESQNADFSWDVLHDSPEAGTATPNLRNITMNISRGSLVAVVGRVGAGKSSLLSAMLGEMEKLRGEVAVRGKIAYVPQQAWIQNLSLRDNILFGQPFNKKFYDRVIEACALGPDLAILPHGDRTEIGEKGINLSGGQKARVSLARAIYQNCNIYFLDDPLSAVDSHVGKHIFNEVIGPNGLLRNKTRVLVTHGVTFLKQVDQVLMVEDGTIVEQGLFDDLSSSENSRLAQLIAASKEDRKSGDVTPTIPNVNVIGDEESVDEMKEEDFMEVGDLPTVEFIRTYSTASMILRRSVRVQKESVPQEQKEEIKGLITKEVVNVGRVKTSVYKEYIKAGGYLLMCTYFAFYFCYQAVMMCRNFWLSSWADDYTLIMNNQTDVMDGKQRLGIYAMFGGIEILLMLLSMIAFIFGTLRASKRLHEPVLINILRSPMSFFDTTPLGRILSRLSKDIEIIDLRFPMVVKMFIMCATQIVFILLINTITNPIFLVIIIPLSVIYIFLLRFYIPTARQLRRLESNNRSPIFSTFGETIQGAHVIRAYDKTEDFCNSMNTHIDKFIQVKYMNLLSQRWLGIRLDIIGNSVVLFATVFSVLTTYWGWSSSVGLVGLSVSYALTITEMLNFAVRQISELETNIVSVERLKEYVETETEAPWNVEGKEPPKGWPNNGQVQFEHYSTRYRPGLELVVKDINASIRPGEKVGIVGRTGAGKSSLTLALFRMIEAAEGKISIDGIVIADIGLHDLRSNVTIIPQDPVLFSGSLRFNLDPFDKFSDAEIWNALELAHLKQFVSSLPEGLQHKISEGGDNISVGQRQLLCLARALLRRSKVLVLDEATAAVDLETDSLIQETIRKEFKDSTIFTIAHRLNTILDYDRVMVLDKGAIKEFDSPARLLADKQSIFASMVADAKIYDNESKND